MIRGLWRFRGGALDFLHPVDPLDGARGIGGIAAELDGDRPFAGEHVPESPVVCPELGAGSQRVEGTRSVSALGEDATFPALDRLVRLLVLDDDLVQGGLTGDRWGGIRRDAEL